MVSHPRRTLAQTVVAVGVLGLLAAGVWLATSLPTDGVGCGSTPVCPAAAPCDVVPAAEVVASVPEVVADDTDESEPPFPITALLPEGAEVILTTSWADLRDNAWPHDLSIAHRIQRTLRAPLVELSRAVRDLGGEGWKLGDLLPPGPETWSVEKDVLYGELALAGKIEESLDPITGLPALGSVVLLTRISPELAAAFSQLQVEVVRKRLPPQVDLIDEGDGVYQVTVPTRRRRPSIAPPGGRIEDPHRAYWTVFRMNDIVAIGGQESVHEVAALAKTLAENPALAKLFEDGPSAPPGGLAAEIDLRHRRTTIDAALAKLGASATILSRWFPAATREHLSVRIDGSDSERLRSSAVLTMEPGRLPDRYRSMFADEARSSHEAASRVPAQDTYALLTIRSPADCLLPALLEDLRFTGPKPWLDHLRSSGGLEESRRLLDGIVTALGDSWSLALTRRGDLYDHVEFGGFFDEVHHRDPTTPAWAVVVSLAEGAEAEVLSADLHRASALFEFETNTVMYREREIHLVQAPEAWSEISWLPTAWFVGDEYVVLASSESVLERYVDTLLDPEAAPPLAQDATWQETTADLPAEAHLHLFVDLGKVFRAPTTPGPGGQPRGLMWDRRQEWVVEHYGPGQVGSLRRKKLLREAGRDKERITVRHPYWNSRYPEFEEEYRQKLLESEWLRALGINVVVRSREVHIDSALSAAPAGRR